MSNALFDILRGLRLSGAVFLEAEFTEPWCIVAGVRPEDCRPLMEPPAHLVAYHYVLEGRLMVGLEGQVPRRFGPKHLILFPRNDTHRLGSALDLDPVEVEPLLEPPCGGGPARLRCGGGGARTRILCGFLGCEAPADPLLASLPPVLDIDLSSRHAGDWIEGSIRYALRTLAAGGPDAAARLAQLAELLFSEAIREYLATIPDDDGSWLSGLRDPFVARAVALLHGDLSRNWTLEDLAREAGLSRSALSERFVRRIGLSPMKYLCHRRLAHAAERLRRTAQPIAAIAFDAGYQSEAAFSRAFRRQFGASPGVWRAANDSRAAAADEG